MRFLKFNSINKKICVLVSAVAIYSLFVISIMNYIIANNELKRSNEIILRNAIETVMADINRNHSYTLSDSAWMTEEAAKESSINMIQNLLNEEVEATSGATVGTDAVSAATENSTYRIHTLDLGETGYFYILNSQGDIIYHPSMEGNVSNVQTKDGRLILPEIIDTAKNGGGILSYTLSDKSLKDKQTVYTMYFPHWDWIVSAVTYDKELARGSSIILLSNTIAVVLTLVLAIAITIFITRRITKPIKQVTHILEQVSNGDLTQEKIKIKAKDETKILGDSVNRLLDSFNDILKTMITSGDRINTFSSDLRETSSYMSQATAEVAQTISHIAEATQEQYKDTMDSVSKVTKLGEDINETAEASNQIEALVQQNLELKEQGLSSVNNLKDANRLNKTNANELEKVIGRISEHSQDIGEITTIITNVAKQTNLLALNASIEASRAGEHGASFAVVAEEIRKLASEISISTEKIRNQISDMQNQSEEAVRFVQVNKSGVKKINSSVEDTENIFQKISDSLQQLVEGIKVIANNNYNINRQKDEVLTLLHHVSATAEDNSASIEEVSASTEEQSATVVGISDSIVQLNEMTKELDNLINRFKIKE